MPGQELLRKLFKYKTNTKAACIPMLPQYRQHKACLAGRVCTRQGGMFLLLDQQCWYKACPTQRVLPAKAHRLASLHRAGNVSHLPHTGDAVACTLTNAIPSQPRLRIWQPDYSPSFTCHIAQPQGHQCRSCPPYATRAIRPYVMPTAHGQVTRPYLRASGLYPAIRARGCCYPDAEYAPAPTSWLCCPPIDALLRSRR